MTTLVIETRCQRTYRHDGASNIREAKRELRWTNTRGEKRQMALAFVADWRMEVAE